MKIIHMSENNYLEKKEIIKQLTEQMFQHRKTLGLTQAKVAELLGRPEKTYQRWESTGDGLSDISDILNIFRVLHFSATEIINLLGLPQLTLSEVKELYQDEEALKTLRENSIYSFIRQNCGRMQNITIGKLLFTLMEEYLKRKEYI